MKVETALSTVSPSPRQNGQLRLTPLASRIRKHSIVGAFMKSICAFIDWDHMCAHSDILLVEVFAEIGEGRIGDEAGIQSSKKFALLR